MSNLTRATFLGCSVVSTNANLDWGSGVATMDITIVEDFANGDVYEDPLVGSPQSFQYESFRFDGLVQRESYSHDSSGNRLIQITLVDPRIILDGVQLILSDYYSSVYNVPNLYNVYGYLETTYGGSQSNEVGIPWLLIKDAIEVLVATTPINLRGYNYTIDLSQLPLILPSTFRVSGPNKSILDFVSEVCDAASSDFFFKLVGNIITVVVMSRVTQPTPGKITSYLSTLTTGYKSVNYGLELQHHPTSKFIIGPPIEQIYFQNYSVESADDEEDPATYSDNTIWPFWGFDLNNSPVIGHGLDDEHTFTLDGRPIRVYPAFDAGYESDVEEMRYALMGQESWEAFIASKDGVIESIHKDKAEIVGMKAIVKRGLEVFFDGKTTEADLKALSMKDIAPILRKDLSDPFTEQEMHQNRLYEFVLTYAREYYGRKFMVRIPFVYVKRESESNIIRTSLEVADSGYLEESVHINAIANGLLPLDINKLTTQNNKIEAYVKFSGFNNGATIDLSDLSEEDYVVSGTDVFVKCQVDPTIIFLNSSTLFSPRVVITLAGPVRDGQDNADDYFALIRNQFERRATALGLSSQILFEAFLNKTGTEMTALGKSAKRYIPSMAAIPLRNTLVTYGPWYAIGSAGKVEFEQNLNLAPWNFGGYTYMNVAGNAMVSEALSNRQTMETGSIEVPGSPLLDIGTPIILDGPYVTSVNITFSSAGVITTYRFETWSMRPGRFNKYSVDRFERLAKLAQQERRYLRSGFRQLSPLNTSKVTLMRNKSVRRTPHTSNFFIGGEVVQNEDTDLCTVNLGTYPYYNLSTTVGSSGDFSSRFGASLDTIFTPFSTDVNYSGGPHFGTPTSTAISPHVTQLNPFSGVFDGTIFYGNEFPDDLIGSGVRNTVRGIGLRAPMVMAGWGYDTNGKPVPNATPNSPGNNFIDDYKQRMDLWPAGPLDVRWDNDKKIWLASAANIMRGTLLSNLTYSTATAPFSGTNGNIVNVSNWLLTENYIAYSGKRGFATQIDGSWHLFAVQPAC